MDTQNLVALENAQDAEAKFLGRLCWYSVSDLRITREDLEAAFDAVGLDKAHLPRPLNARDAFRRATSAAEVKRQPGDAGTYLNLLVREVKASPDLLVRQVVREIVDSNNVRLEYVPLANLRLERDRLTVEPLAPLSEAEEVMLDKVRQDYETERRHYNGRHMRDLVMEILERCSPVSVRPSGGVYFVPERHAGTLSALTGFVDRLNAHKINGGRCRFWHIPVIDAQHHRVMVAESLEDQVRQDSETLIREMTMLLKGEGRTLTEALATQYIDRVKALKKVVAEYEAFLEAQAIEARATLQLAMQQALALLDKLAERAG